MTRRIVMSLLTIASCLIVVDGFAGDGPAMTPEIEHEVSLGTLPTQRIETGFDAAQLQERDAAQKSRPGPDRFAEPVAVDYGPDSAGAWQVIDSGQRLWLLRFEAPGALNLNLFFDRFELAGGAQLWLRDEAGTVVHGPYDSSDARRGQFWSPVVPGSVVILEISAPDQAASDIHVARVNWGYRHFGANADLGKQGSCNIDVVCPEGDPWRDQIRSVARYTIDGIWLCTGTLINNLAEDRRPLFLSADHCGVTNSNDYTTVFYWNYEAPTCGMLGGGSLLDTQNGADLLASWAWEPNGSDFALMQLDETPDADSNVYYSGWDARSVTPGGAVGIHHPQGTVKAICFDHDPLTPVWGTHWQINAWDEGTTEVGSSGSCIFDPVTKLCVGTLSGGHASCSNPEGADWYGRVDVSWEGNGSSQTRLSDWLDPFDTGVRWVQGLDSVSGAAPIASFVYSPVAPQAGQVVNFTDTSTNEPTSWSWNFGDGMGTTSVRNPAHVFTEAGTYVVSLTVANAWGSQSTVRSVFVSGVEPENPPIYVAAAASTGGVGGSFWSTDLEINNRGQSSLSYVISYLERDADNSNPDTAGPFALGAGQSVRYLNIVGAMFGESGAGALRIDFNNPDDAIVSSRTFNSFAGNGLDGEFGQGIPGIAESELIPFGTTVRLIHLSENLEARSNIGFLNGTEKTIRVRARFFMASGAELGEDFVDLKPFSNTQWNRAFEKVTVADVDDGYVDIWAETGGALFTVYGSFIGNDDFNDPTTIFPR